MKNSLKTIEEWSVIDEIFLITNRIYYVYYAILY